MPGVVVWALVTGGAGFVTGFTAGGGVDGISRAVKWGVAGAGVYVAGKALKVI